MSPIADVFVEAAAQAGHERNPDFNGARQEGFGRYQVTQENGMRASTSVRYLHPNMERENLTIITDALALRVLFDGDRASGVEIDHAGTVEEVHAAREIILSAGAYQSPQLLMLSGVGPGEMLPLLGIEVRKDLPVGEGLQDHCMTLINWKADHESLMTALTPENVEQLQSAGTGPLSSNIAEAGGFIRSRPGLDAPDCQFHCAPVLFHEEGLGAATEHGVAFGPGVVKPTSRGAVTLRTASPYVKPRIQHNYLTTEEDRATILAGTKIALEIAEQDAFDGIITGVFSAPTANASDDELWSFIEDQTMTIFHPTSTCAIGPVVDPRLKVHGVDGLRVVDASVMPTIVRGNTNAATIMIAEKAADLIKEDAAA
jgi:choline dehydrogenase